MTTFGDLINDVLLAFEGWGLQQGRAAFTSGSLTSSATTFTVANADNLSEGVAEIDEELIYIKGLSGTTITISADGRGYRGTTAASHASGARVTMNPILPVAVVKQKINDTIRGVYPTLRGKGSTTLTYSNVTSTYELPAECEQVLSVSFDSISTDGEWPKVYHYRVDMNADTTAFASGKSITLPNNLDHQRSVRVVYLKAPSVLSSSSADLTTTGLAESARALIVAGAVWRLSSFIAASRLRVDSTSIDMMDEQNRVDAGNKVSAYLRAQYELELQEEKRRQELNQPPTMSWMD